MRRIDEVIWHCAATPEGRDVKTATIREWHLGNGWRDIGYHYVIELDGSVHPGRPEAQAGAHVRGRNAHSIGVCYVGGVDDKGKPKDTRTKAQKKALYELTQRLMARFPGAIVRGHNEFANKACPSFDARADWMAHMLSLPIERENFAEDDAPEA